MTANSVVRARIDEETKREAAAVLQAMGLTVSDAFRLMMVRIAKEKALPFEPLVPNEETIEAMKAARRGELMTVGPPGKLLQEPECGLLNTPAAFGATISGRSRDSTASASMRCCSKQSTCWPQDEPLPHRYFDHPLGGEWKDHRDCHIRPDLILIYRKPDDASLELVRLGSHSELGL